MPRLKTKYAPYDSIQFVPKGAETVAYQPADFILTHREGIFDDLIQLGQLTRYPLKRARWTHAALIISSTGDLIEATATGVQQSHLSNYQPEEYCVVQIVASPQDRQQAVDFAHACLTQEYGWTTIASIGISLLSGLRFSFGFEGQEICSGLVARALERTGAIFPHDASHIMPADLADYYDVRDGDYYTALLKVNQQTGIA